MKEFIGDSDRFSEEEPFAAEIFSPTGPESMESFVLPQIKPEEQVEEYVVRVTKENERYRKGSGISLSKAMNDQALPEVRPYIVESLALVKATAEQAVKEKFSVIKRQEVITAIENAIKFALNEPKIIDGGLPSFSHTKINRWFGDAAKSTDNVPYSQLLFGLFYDQGFDFSPEVHAYFKEILDGKNVLLLGGGDSVHDLVAGLSQDDVEAINPKRIISTDSMAGFEQVKLEPLVQAVLDEGSYVRKQAHAEKSEEVAAVLASVGLEKGADEIWASFSVPYYLETPKQLKGLFTTIRNNLAKGGTARIAPIAFQVSNDRLMNRPEEVDEMKKTLLDEVSSLSEDPEFNVYVFSSGVGSTLVIKRLK